MNTERLNALALAVQADLEATDTLGLLDQLATAMGQMVSQPTAAPHQEQVSRFRSELAEALANAPSNQFSPAWTENLDQLGIIHLLGSRLADAIEAAFVGNDLTPSIASEEIGDLAGEVRNMSETLQSLTEAMAELGIGAEELDPGDFEVGFLIPRKEAPALLDLSRDFKLLDRVFGDFVELAEGKREHLQINSLSSSDWGVFLEAAGPTAAMFVFALERIIKGYKSILEIRKLHKELRDLDVRQDVLTSLEEDAASRMEIVVSETATELVEEFAHEDLDDQRTNELRNAIEISLEVLSTSIDRGYNFEVRVGPALEDDTESTPGEAEDEHRKMVIDRSESLRFLSPPGNPILGLPIGEDGEEE